MQTFYHSKKHGAFEPLFYFLNKRREFKWNKNLLPLSEIKLSIPPAKSTLDRDVLIYVLEIFDNYIEEHDPIKQITEKDLLTGAKDWQQYSRGRFSLIYDENICKRLPHYQNKRKQEVVN